MKTIKTLLLAVLVLGMSVSCQAQTSKKEETAKITKPEQVEVYYFHYTRRCHTCQTVQNVSKDAVAELYGGKVSFADFNLEDDQGKAKGKEIGVSGQSLLIVSGDTKINITNEGFMNARNPEKLKAIIKEKIDPLL
jgi:hypothetical protein